MPFSWLKKWISKPVSGSNPSVRLPFDTLSAIPAEHLGESTPHPSLLADSCLWKQRPAMTATAPEYDAIPSSRCGFVSGIPTEGNGRPAIALEPSPELQNSTHQPKDERIEDDDNPFHDSNFSLWGNRIPLRSAVSGPGKNISINPTPHLK
ncbi:MAG: hypothetical protein HGB02_09560 [Chlorobiaceae bacterium]|nr:hypothetical protein [Chlorobiaceae bacterium]